VRDGNGYTIKTSVAAHVTFRHESVFAPRPDAPFDVVVCRNMLIYFDRPSMERFCSSLHGRVKPGGYLFLGHTEIMGEIYGFDYLEPSVWRRKG
jgi:chemotaxis protein methyltransferase CheR